MPTLPETSLDQPSSSFSFEGLGQADHDLGARQSHDIFETYENNVIITPAASNEVIYEDEQVARLVTDHAVKWAPSLSEQLEDGDTRTNAVIYFEGQPPTSFMDIFQKIQEDGEAAVTSEHAALEGLRTFLEEHLMRTTDKELREKASGLSEELTFIGEKEYQEATTAIAVYWKHELRQNKDLQLCAIAGVSASPEYERNSTIKSDSYLLDTILSHFSDEEMEEFRGRLQTNPEYITATQPEDMKIVLLDDWIISGQQMQTARYNFLQEYPQYENSFEIQLVAARQEDINMGFSLPDKSGKVRQDAPIRAYYVARESLSAERAAGARITGVHSSVDYGFRHDLTKLALEASKDGASTDSAKTPPALANIKRPYRQDGFVLENIARLQRTTAKH